MDRSSPPRYPRGGRLVAAAASLALAATLGLAGVALAPAAQADVPPLPGPVATATTLTGTPAGPVAVGTQVTLRATVTAVAPAVTPLVGRVTLTGPGVATGTWKAVSATSPAATFPVSPVLGSTTYTATFTPEGADAAAYTGSVGQLVVVVTKTATSVTLTTSPTAAVDAGKQLTLKAKVRPAVAGRILFSDNGRQVATVRVVDGLARWRGVPAKGYHRYRAVFTPQDSARYLPATSVIRGVTAGAARSLPLARGAFGPLVRKTQQRLTWAGILVKASGTYDNATVVAVKRFQGKFFLSQTGVVTERTMAQLRAVGVKSLPRACRTVGRALCIDKTRKITQLVVRGKVVMSLDARFGSVRTAGLATREGTFTVYRKSPRHISSAYHTSMPYSMFFSGGQAVHYSQYFAAVGYNGASHGCVNIRDYDGVAKMYALTPIGTRVYVYRS